MIEVEMFDGPKLVVNRDHVAVVIKTNGPLVNVCTLVFSTPVLRPTTIRGTVDEVGRRFGFSRVETLDSEPGYVNPATVAQVMPKGDRIGESVLVFASTGILPTNVRGSVSDVRRLLDTPPSGLVSL